MKSLTHCSASFGAAFCAAAALLLGASSASADEEVAGEEKPKERWYDAIAVSAFVDTYFSLNLNFPKPPSGTNLLHGNDLNNGFSLAQVGLDAAYEGDNVGATINLRFGPQAIAYAGSDVEPGFGLQYLRQGFLTWKPSDKLALDFGKWDTFAGGESIDSQYAFNYTRGLVHWLAQPTFHTGLRAAYAPFEELNILAFVANGWNRTVDNNLGKTFGLQIGVLPSDKLSVNVGYIVGPEQDDTFTVTGREGEEETRSLGSANKRFRHLLDLVATFDPTDEMSLLFNADLGLEQVLTAPFGTETHYTKWFGAMLASRYAFTDSLAGAIRAEIYKDPDGYTSGLGSDVTLASGTLTVEATPSPHLIIKLDGRVDYGSDEYFQQNAGYAPEGDADNNASSFQPTITLGVVAKTN